MNTFQSFVQSIEGPLFLLLIAWLAWLTVSNIAEQKARGELRTEIQQVRTEMATQLALYAQRPEVTRLEEKIDKLQADFASSMINVMSLLSEIKGRAAAAAQVAGHG
jgi:hypothetical protein